MDGWIEVNFAMVGVLGAGWVEFSSSSCLRGLRRRINRILTQMVVWLCIQQFERPRNNICPKGK